MSAYFQRLIQQSGLHVQEPLASPAPATGFIASSPPPPLSSGPDVFEIHEELPSTPSMGSNPGPAQSLPLSPSVSPQTTQPAPSAISPAISREAPAEHVVHERIEVAATALSLPAPKTPLPSSAPVHPFADAPTHTAQPGNIPTPKGIPADVMQALMRWISAGPAELSAKSISSAEPPPRDNVSSVVSSTSVDSSEKAPPATPAIPERVIEIVEEYFESPPPPAPAAAPVSRVAAPAQRPFAAPAAALEAPPVDPVQVSIGSINVRIEAPPPPAPIRAPRADTHRAAQPARSSHFSKLRRHYILPH